jgi:hypothetical protein
LVCVSKRGSVVYRVNEGEDVKVGRGEKGGSALGITE